MKKRTTIIIIFLIIACLFMYRYYKVNKDVPLKYTIDYYNKNDKINCDDISIKIVSINEVNNPSEEKTDNELINIEIISELKNTSYTLKNASSFIESALVTNTSMIQSGYPEIYGNILKISNNETVTIKQIFKINKKLYDKDKGNWYLCLSERLYPNEVEEKFKSKIRYRKAVKI